MNKKNTVYAALWALLLLVAGGCSTDNDAMPPRDITLRFTAGGNATRADIGATDPGTAAENAINRLSVWFILSGTADNAAASYFCDASALAADSEVILTVTEDELRQAGLRPNATYSLYAAANLTESAADLKALTLADLKSRTFTAAARPASPFTMSGKVTDYDFSLDRALTIPLNRHAVKLTISLLNETSSATWTINSVKVVDDQQTAALFEPDAAATPPASDAFATALALSSTPTTDSPASFTAYVYENLSTVPTVIEVNATVGGASKTYTAEVMPQNAPKLLRNTACQVTLRLKQGTTRSQTLLQQCSTSLPTTSHGLRSLFQPLKTTSHR